MINCYLSGVLAVTLNLIGIIPSKCRHCTL